MAKGKSHSRPGRTLLNRQRKALEAKKAKTYDRQRYDKPAGEES